MAGNMVAAMVMIIIVFMPMVMPTMGIVGTFIVAIMKKTAPAKGGGGAAV